MVKANPKLHTHTQPQRILCPSAKTTFQEANPSFTAEQELIKAFLSRIDLKS